MPRRPVSGQGQPGLLAQRLEPLPRARRPIGVRLVFEQLSVLRQSGGKPVVAVLPRLRRQPGRKRVLLPVGVDVEGHRHPDETEVGRQQRGARLAETGERDTRHGQRLGQRTGRRPGVEAREQFLARDIAANPAARTDEDELTEPFGGRPWPGAGHLAARRDGELTEQPDPHGPVYSRVPPGSTRHDPIIAVGSDISREFFRRLRRSRDQGTIVTKRYETWTTVTKHNELSVSRATTSPARPDPL
jgi:hypothetical protein